MVKSSRSTLGKVFAQPGGGEEEVLFREAVPGIAPLEGEIGTGLREDGGESFGAGWGNHVVMTAGEEQDGSFSQIRRMWRIEGNHGAEQDRTGEQSGAQEQKRGRDVGAIGVAHGDDPTEVLVGGLVFDEIGQFVRSADEVFLIEDSRSEAAEESRGTVFQDLSAGAEQGGAGAELAAETDQVVFISAGAVEQEERG